MGLSRRAEQAAPNRRGDGRAGRVVLALLAVATLFVAAGVAGWDVTRRTEAGREQAESTLNHVAAVVDTLHHAEDRAVAATLRELRTALRAEGSWARADPGMDEQGHRRLMALLSRALAEHDDMSRFELIVAGHQGLSALALGRDGESSQVVEWDDETRARMAKSLWYADEVKRAVAAAGRRIERGDIGFEGDPERPRARIAIALHDPGELVQAALIGVVDLARRGQRLKDLVPAGTDFAWLSLEGRSLDPIPRSPEATARLAGVATEAFTGEAATAIAAVDGHWALARPLALADAAPAQSIAIFEVAAPETPLALLLATPWPWALSAHAFCVFVALFAIARAGAGAGAANLAVPVPVDESIAMDAADGMPHEPEAIEARRERVVLRDWLADVRGCLEREAAARGLAVDLRCARALEETVEADPGWLGGLLVAMGREALDAATEPTIRMSVRPDEADGVRFEVDAGEVTLAPVAGMREVAAAVGARFETGAGGRLALVAPGIRA